MFPKPQRKKDEELLESVRWQPCIICDAAPPSDPSHISTRGSGGDDTPFNVYPKCRKHHNEWHALGWYRFLGKYPAFCETLLQAGWEMDLLTKKLYHRSLR
jgi:hypothetical protein